MFGLDLDDNGSHPRAALLLFPSRWRALFLLRENRNEVMRQVGLHFFPNVAVAKERRDAVKVLVNGAELGSTVDVWKGKFGVAQALTLSGVNGDGCVMVTAPNGQVTRFDVRYRRPKESELRHRDTPECEVNEDMPEEAEGNGSRRGVCHIFW